MADGEQRLLMLVAEDAGQFRQIGGIAAREGWRVLHAADTVAAFDLASSRQAQRLDAIVIDLPLPAGSARRLLEQLRKLRGAAPIVFVSEPDFALHPSAAMRAGASDVLIKPVSPDQWTRALRAVAEFGRDPLAPLSEKLAAPPDFEAMVGATPTFRAALAVAAKAARGHGPVLVEGERGTGKETLIRAVHAASMRAKAPLRIVAIGCLSPSAIESALFGHEKDAFPGAFERQAGALQQCDGGTLVIDEIDRLPAALQERLLEVLQRASVRPMGAPHGFRVDVRLIAASDEPLQGLVARRQFLPELAALLGHVTVTLPPLRDRVSDIPALTRHFLTLIGEQSGLHELGITDGALALLGGYAWPGNVRQLHAALLRAAIGCDGDALTAADFPTLAAKSADAPAAASLLAGHHPHSPESAGVMLYTSDGNLRPLEEIEGDVIRLAIGLYRGRMTEVARRLGIGRSTLYRKLGELGIDNLA